MDGRDEDGFEKPALRVVEEVAQAAGADSLGLDPLSVTIDPDSRNALLANADQDVEVASKYRPSYRIASCDDPTLITNVDGAIDHKEGCRTPGRRVRSTDEEPTSKVR